MRLLARVILVVTTLSFLGSSTLAAMPLVWCAGNDGHRVIEPLLHQHAAQTPENSEGDPHGPCTDWHLLGATNVLQVKALEEAPKDLTGILAHPPLRVIIAQSAPSRESVLAGPRLRKPGPLLRTLRSVVLLI